MNSKMIKDFILDLFDVVTFLVFVGGIVLFVRFFIFNPYTVVGESMAPTFHESDFIIVDKISSKYGELKRWDVIVFVPPGKDIPYIKRIIWLPGETVKVKDGLVQICKNVSNSEKCEILDESYLPEWLKTEARCGITDFPVDTWFFVMGDNRPHSTDSLCCFGLGCYNNANYLVPDDRIIGKVSFRLFPFAQATANTSN